MIKKSALLRQIDENRLLRFSSSIFFAKKKHEKKIAKH